MMHEVDVLIIGQGIAGSTLAAQLVGREQRVMVVDREEGVTSSKIAAGLVTPITGKNLALSWRLPELLPAAEAFYRTAEAVTGAAFWHPKPIVRILRGEDEAALWQRRRQEAAYQPFIRRPWIAPDEAGECLKAPFGAFEMQGGGHVDVPAFLGAIRRFLKRNHAYRAAECHLDSIDCSSTDGVRWQDVRARVAVFCQGGEGGRNPFFDWVPFKSAKGEILDLRIDGFSEQRVINSGGWILPVGRQGMFRAGSTYSWDPLDTVPTEAAKRRIMRNVRRTIAASRPRIEGHAAAVRPIINGSRAVIGRHPAKPQVAFFNGLGSKGVLVAPFFAAQLADHLVHGAPIEEASDVRSNRMTCR